MQSPPNTTYHFKEVHMRVTSKHIIDNVEVAFHIRASITSSSPISTYGDACPNRASKLLLIFLHVDVAFTIKLNHITSYILGMTMSILPIGYPQNYP